MISDDDFLETKSILENILAKINDGSKIEKKFKVAVTYFHLKIKQGILAELYKEIEDYDRGVNRPRERRGGNLNFIDQYNEEVKELINKVVSNKKRIWDEKE